MSDSEQKAETLARMIGLHNQVSETKAQIRTLTARVDKLEEKNCVEHREMKNTIKHTAWEIGQLAIGHRAEIDKQNHRITDTKERVDKLQNIVSWAIYTIAGLFITTLIAAILKFVLGV